MTEPVRDGGASHLAGEDAEHEAAAPDGPGPGLPPPSAVESLVGSLLEAGPEVAEHVVRAAQELLLAAQVIVDAAERVVQEQQSVRDHASGAAGDLHDEPEDGAATVHHLDLAE